MGGGSPKADFAVLPGDGGLVKGVLAHVAALASLPDWSLRHVTAAGGGAAVLTVAERV